MEDYERKRLQNEIISSKRSIKEKRLRLNAVSEELIETMKIED